MSNEQIKALIAAYTPDWDRKFRISLTLNIVLLLLLGGLWLGWNRICVPCGAVERVVIKYDTIRPKDEPKIIYADKPVPKKAKKITAKDNVTPIQVVTVEKWKRDTVTLTKENACDYITNYELDTVILNQAHIVIKDEVVGYINKRQIEYANLTPQVTKTVTITKPDRVKVYVGVAGTFNGNEFKRWGIGPQGALSIPKVGAITYYYDAHNNAHTAGFLALLRFRK